MCDVHRWVGTHVTDNHGQPETSANHRSEYRSQLRTDGPWLKPRDVDSRQDKQESKPELNMDTVAVQEAAWVE
jgi:hypothetical protein